jgi:hypothetical protein
MWAVVKAVCRPIFVSAPFTLNVRSPLIMTPLIWLLVFGAMGRDSPLAKASIPPLIAPPFSVQAPVELLNVKGWPAELSQVPVIDTALPEAKERAPNPAVVKLPPRFTVEVASALMVPVFDQVPARLSVEPPVAEMPPALLQLAALMVRMPPPVALALLPLAFVKLAGSTVNDLPLT